VSLRDRDALLTETDERDADLRHGQRRGWLHSMPQAIKNSPRACVGEVSLEA
jgi:amidase